MGSSAYEGVVLVGGALAGVGTRSLAARLKQDAIPVYPGDGPHACFESS